MKITRLFFRLEELSKPLQINYVVGSHCLEKSNNNDLLLCQQASVYLVACGNNNNLLFCQQEIKCLFGDPKGSRVF
jgi:hypothetical protein